MALPSAHRLRGHRPFDRIYRQGRRHQGNWMVLRLLPADSSLLPPGCRRHPPSAWRCSVVVSSKVHKRAVRRNRLRRILHQELRREPPRSPRPLWLLLSLRPGSAEIEEERLLGEWNDLLRQAGLRP